MTPRREGLLGGSAEHDLWLHATTMMEIESRRCPPRTLGAPSDMGNPEPGHTSNQKPKKKKQVSSLRVWNSRGTGEAKVKTIRETLEASPNSERSRETVAGV